jgi:hypothetical protein
MVSGLPAHNAFAAKPDEIIPFGQHAAIPATRRR